MKEKFTTIDLCAVLGEINQSLLGMRVVNVYDVDQKTYLIKLAKPDKKVILLFESGCRIHITEFEWPKSLQPSGFSMKLRKHLRSRRLVSISQLGVDRVVDLQFGSNEAAYHIIIELYDRGNVILTDCSYSILSLLRTRTDADTDVRFATRQVFSMETVKMEQPPPTEEVVRDILASAKAGDQLKQILNPHFVYGSALLSHSLLGIGLKDNVKIGNGLDPITDLPQVMAALQEADTLFRNFKEKPGKGIIIQKKQIEPLIDQLDEASGGGEVMTNIEFHPMLFRQHEKSPFKEVESFNKAVDEFFSSKSSQKQDLKALNVKKTAVKKLDNIRKDHFKRIEELQKTQEVDMYKAQLIEINSELVTKASLVIRNAVANAMDWGDIELLVKDAQSRDDPVALAIQSLKLKSNEITLILKDPSDDWEDSDSSDKDDITSAVKKDKKKNRGTKVDIDLGLSAFANATRYYGHKKHSAKKEQKTIDASEKALKSAEKKAKQTLKEAMKVAKIQKARKVHWFEKFFWFISSENYLVLGGRDQQQNELLVKKYLKEGDVYVHADIHGATSVIIKNPRGGPVTWKTLNEAGFMAVCYSSAWDARIVTSAWWVYHHQVSKTAPSGEYLTTGSFMIRGKKNFLPPCQLVLGFGFLFKVEDSCIPNHLHERKVRDEEGGELSKDTGKVDILESIDDGEEINIEDDGVESGGEEGEGKDVVVLEEIGEESSSDEEAEFPNTLITFSHISGDKYELQLGAASTSPTVTDKNFVDSHDLETEPTKTHQHLSAKQKRDLRKQRMSKPGDTGCIKNTEPKPSPKTPAQSMPTQNQPQTKRGQKFKQKKAREKYGDQDEDERHLMMEFLASAGPQKEPKRNKKNKGKKKSFDTIQSSNPKLKYKQKDKVKGPVTIAEQTHKQKDPAIVSIHKNTVPVNDDHSRTVGDTRTSEELPTAETSGEKADLDMETGGIPVSDVAEEKEKEEIREEEKIEDDDGDTGELTPKDGSDGGADESDEDEKKALLAEENIHMLEEAEREQLTILDALTGCPLADDLLLYAIPVCGPYSAMINYKYKVKLIPGTNRRGKAAKAAVHRFTQSKDALQREKDLLKSVKDNDLSRYIPGKVKMSLPQSHKHQYR